MGIHSYRNVFCAIAMLVAASASYAQETRSVDVRFSAGSSDTNLSGTIVGYDTVQYKVGAEANQTMRVTLAPTNLATYFNVYTPGSGPGDAALATPQSSLENNDWAGTLPASGEYTVSVFMMRSAARRNERSDFTINISVTGATGDRVESDFADGLAGGPDYFAVNVSGGGSLNMRAAPSAGAGIVTRLSNGQNLRNLGCRMSEGLRWCRIATLSDPGLEGWAAGNFLIEASGQVTQLPAFVPGDVEQRVRFAAGSTGAELSGSLAPGQTRRYIIGASSGQDLYVRVAPQAQPISYQIFNPDRSFLLDQMTSDREYRGELWQSGDHVIEVINRTNSIASYSVIIGIE